LTEKRSLKKLKNHLKRTNEKNEGANTQTLEGGLGRGGRTIKLKCRKKKSSWVGSNLKSGIRGDHRSKVLTQGVMIPKRRRGKFAKKRR